MGSSYRGADGLRRYWSDLLTNFPDFTTEPLDVIDVGGLTLCTVRFRGHGAGSAAPFEQVVWQLAALARRQDRLVAQLRERGQRRCRPAEELSGADYW